MNAKRGMFVFCRLAVLGKLNSFVKEWISEISESKASKPAGLLVRSPGYMRCFSNRSF